MTIEIKECRYRNGCDCWGKYEYDYNYKIYKDDKYIGSFDSDISDFIKRLLGDDVKIIHTEE